MSWRAAEKVIWANTAAEACDFYYGSGAGGAG